MLLAFSSEADFHIYEPFKIFIKNTLTADTAGILPSRCSSTSASILNHTSNQYGCNNLYGLWLREAAGRH